MWNTFYSFSEIIATFTGIIGAIISCFIWFKVRSQNQKLKEFATTLKALNTNDEINKAFIGITSDNPKAFCLSLIPADASIKERVEKYLHSRYNKMPIIELNRDGLSAETFVDFINEVKKKRRGELSDASEIHLFIQGPIIAGTIIGAIFDHWVPVKLYHYNTKIFEYEYWGVLMKAN